MAEYRAYVVGRDGHHLRSHAFVAADEESAIEHAKKFIDVHNVELWSGTRFIARLDHKAPNECGVMGTRLSLPAR